MAMSWNIRDQFVIGDRQMVLATGTFDASYPTGGEPIAASDFNLGRIHFVSPSAPNIADEALVNVRWDRAASTLIATVQDGTQEGATTDLAATTVEVMVVGR